ncbi:MAG TPA: hypothetical protein VIX20_05720 [Ktedonobacteraceae bacterium]
MRMQEPEQSQSSQEYSQGYNANSALNSEDFESEQEQKIYPQKSRWLDGTALAIFAIIFSSIGFFFTVAGVVASAIALQFGHAQQVVLAGGITGLISSIVAMLMCIGIFVIAVITLALRTRRVRRRWRIGL